MSNVKSVFITARLYFNTGHILAPVESLVIVSFFKSGIAVSGRRRMEIGLPTLTASIATSDMN